MTVQCLSVRGAFIVPALKADAVLTGHHRAVVRHRGTAGTDAAHSLLLPQPLQLDDVSAVQLQVPHAAAVQMTLARVQRPRQLALARRSADVQRRAEIQRSVVLSSQLVLPLIAVQSQPQRPTVAVDPDAMLSAVVDPSSHQEALSLGAEVEQDVEVAVAQLNGEEVRPAAAWTGHHHDPVTLDRLEAELHPAVAAWRPLGQAEVRPARGEGD